MIGYNPKHGRWLIVVTFIIALLLDILPLPGVTLWFRPQWTLLILLYWCMALPDIVGVTWAFSLGLILDLLNGTLLGEHAFAMVVVAYIVLKFCQLIRVYPLIQQTVIVFLLLLLYQLLIFIIQGFISSLPHTMLYWLSSIISTILWPWIFILLRDWRRRISVS